ncbi:MAG: molybdopterin molybdenumtransferase MoeA [Thermoleophilia bacterium]|nr:MAG: molybdopterin molybdenumtransferase MoeA [Thermoleophilia bacterium]
MALGEAGFVAPLGSERVPVGEAVGRVAAQAISAVRPSPPLRVAAMDGIAVRAEDTEGAPRLLATTDFELIDTGAPLPDGFDAVVVREQVTIDGAGAHVQETVAPGRHVRPVGEDIPFDEVLIQAGQRLGAFDVALVAAAGQAVVDVVRQPAVAIIPTGDELRSAGERLDAHHVIDSNGPMLIAQATADGARATLHPRVTDDPKLLAAEVMRAVLSNDLVLLVAGSSRGRRDYARDVLDELGEVAVDGVAVRPGHPVLLAVVGTTPVIGVPGYPVSAAFTYELFARPLLGELLGALPPRPTVEVRLAEAIGGRDDSTCMVAVELDSAGGDMPTATPCARRAGALRSLAGADGYVIVPPGEGFAAGAVVTALVFA